MIVYNQASFDKDGYSTEEARILHSYIEYIPISSQIKETVPYKVEMTALELHDGTFLMMDDLNWDQ